jgi:uncharacterized protein
LAFLARLSARMLLDLRAFRGGTEEVTRQYRPEAFAPAADFRIVASVDLAIRVTKDARKVRLAGRLRASLDVDCSRCLEPFAVPVDAELDLLFLPQPGEGTGKSAAEDDVADDDIGVSFYVNDTIDLGEMMRDEFYLALPMKALCQADCMGLCPVCGFNRNRETCACKADWVDPRMESPKTRSEPRRIGTHDAESRDDTEDAHGQAPDGRAQAQAVSTCPQCHAEAAARGCPNRGHYRGRQVKAVGEE